MIDYIDRINIEKAKKNWSNRDFSKASGVPESSLSRYLSKQRKPGATEIYQIAQALGKSVEYFMTGEGGPNTNSPKVVVAQKQDETVMSAKPRGQLDPNRPRVDFYDTTKDTYDNTIAKVVRMELGDDKMAPVFSKGDIITINPLDKQGQYICIKQGSKTIIREAIFRESEVLLLTKDGKPPVSVKPPDLEIIGSVLELNRKF